MKSFFLAISILCVTIQTFAAGSQDFKTETTTISIAFLPIIDALPLYVAQSEGYFSEEKSVSPCMNLPGMACQNIMDQLWNMGFRPKERKHEGEQIKVLENHLQDMRALVSNKFDVPLKNCERKGEHNYSSQDITHQFGKYLEESF